MSTAWTPYLAANHGATANGSSSPPVRCSWAVPMTRPSTSSGASRCMSVRKSGSTTPIVMPHASAPAAMTANRVVPTYAIPPRPIVAAPSASPRADTTFEGSLGKSRAPTARPRPKIEFIQPIVSTPVRTTSRKNSGSSAPKAPNPSQIALPTRT